MIRLVCVLAAAMLLSPGMTAADAWTEQTVSIDGGPAPLRGTLTMPAGEADVDAALILSGSGPTDRNGNVPGGYNNSLSLLAHDLAITGIASLRVDKRGIAESLLAAPREQEMRIGIYVEDAVRWLDFLEAQPRIRRLFLIGHSEGALVATLAAQRKSVSGIVTIAGAGRPLAALIDEQLAASNVSADLQARAGEILRHLEKGETIADVPPELASLFRPDVQPYMISWLAYDPAAELAKLSIPALIIQGTRDLQASLADAERLAEAHDGATFLIVEDMNHVLKIAPADRAGNLRLYADPGVPLAPALVPAIADFIGAR